MMIIDNKFNIGDTVYLVTDKYQEARLVTGMIIRCMENNILYMLSLGREESSHYDFEISYEKDILTKVS